MNTPKILLARALAMGALAVPVAALAAASAPANLNVSLTINTSCTINNATLTFPPQSGSLTSTVDASATITLNCTNGTPYAIWFDQGINVSGFQRRLRTGSSNYLNYNIYREASRTTVLGPASGGVNNTIAGIGTGAAKTETVYGRVPAQAIPTAGTYVDLVKMTVQY